MEDVGEEFHVAHKGAAEAFAGASRRLFQRAGEGVFRAGEHMEEISAQDVSCKAERFRLFDQSCCEGVGA